MKKILITFVLAAMATPSFAWGPREQGILTGVAGLWVFQQLDRAGRPQIVQQPVIIQPPVQMPAPIVYGATQYCETKPVQDQFGTWQYATFCYYR